MCSGLCWWESFEERRCRRTEFLPCDPHTLLLVNSSRLKVKWSPCYCDRTRKWAGEQNKLQEWALRPAALSTPSPFLLMHLYTPLLYPHLTSPVHSNPPPNSRSLYTSPQTSAQICPDDLSGSRICNYIPKYTNHITLNKVIL